MSHELRTPLNSIIGYAEVLLDGLDGDLTEDAVEDVEDIHNSGKHLLSIINDILDLAKIEAGEMTINPKVTELTPVVNDVLRTAQVLVKGKPVELESVVLSEDLPPVYADPLRLQQIILNLVSNSAKFTEEGKVAVHYGIQDDQNVVIKVVDTGIGMSEEQLGIIFDRFQQADGTSTRKAEGTGLGLSITRHLVELHKGEIFVESEEGVGSMFWFTLPTYLPELA